MQSDIFNSNPNQTLNLNYQNQILTSQLIQNQNQENQNEEMKYKQEEPIIPERTIISYYDDSFLTDSCLKGKNFDIPCHKIIIAAASNYVNEYLKLCNNKENIMIEVPEIFQSEFSMGNHKYCMETLIKYCYSNQDFNIIKDDISKNNIFTLLGYAQCLKINSLIKHLERMIINHFIDDENVSKIASESVLFELSDLNKECMNRIRKNYSKMKGKKYMGNIIDFNYDTFKLFVSADEIDMENEKEICDLIKDYIQSRRDLPKENLIKNEEKKDEINKSKDIQDNDDNKSHKEDNNEEEKNEEEDNNEEEKKDEEEEKKDEEEKKEEEEEKKEDEEEKKEDEEEKKKKTKKKKKKKTKKS